MEKSRAGRWLGVPGDHSGFSGWVPALRGEPPESLLFSGARPAIGRSTPLVAGRAQALLSLETKP